MIAKILNATLFYATWFALVLGGAQGDASLGYAFAGGTVLIHLFFSRNRGREFLMLLLMAFIGGAIDSVPLSLGAFRFLEPPAVPWGYPLWMSALWLTFATTLRSSLGWLSGRYLTAAALGAIGGPVAYVAGERLNAIEIARTPQGLLLIALSWTIAVAFSVWLSDRRPPARASLS